MDRGRRAAALLALAACIACSNAAPTANNQTALEIPEGLSNGCYYNFQHYGEGDRIMTNEPCLNCTCHNRMLMCYLRVCPFTKAIGQDCTVEKRADQCCPIVTCPDVPVDLLTSTSTSSPAEYGATGLGKLDKYGCSINDKYFPEGAKVPSSPNKPCEHCYCIRNMTTCVMQECTLHVDGCTPIYHKDVCCPVRYSCDHPEDEIPLLDDMTTTTRPTPGFLLTTTTALPATQGPVDCVHDGQIIADGSLMKTEKPCENCYCMKGDIVCVVQACGTPMENEGKNCTSVTPRHDQCCPDTYICEGGEVSTEISTEIEDLTTIPPRRTGIEGSGYRNEPDEPFTPVSPFDNENEGSGEDHLITTPIAETPLFEKVTPDISETLKDTYEFSTQSNIPEPNNIGQNTVPDFIDNEENETFRKTTERYQSPEVTKKESSAESDSAVPTEHHHYTSTSIPNISASENSETLPTETFVAEVTDVTPTIYQTTLSDHTTDKVTLKEDSLIAEREHKPFTKSPSENKYEATTLKIEHIDTTQAVISQESTNLPKLDDFETTTSEKDLHTAIHDFSSDVNTTPKEAYSTAETTSINPIENEIQEPIAPMISPGRIPGEGDCLLNSITYKNNSIVPSTNNCHTSCICVSSIVKCDPIKCSTPPDYMNDCQPIYDSPESCCPTYICNTKETVPPESHNQMSEIDKIQPVPETECTSVECLSLESNKQSPSPDCLNNECPKINKDCSSESGCQDTQSTPCDGDECKIKHKHDEVPVTELQISPSCLGETECNKPTNIDNQKEVQSTDIPNVVKEIPELSTESINKAEGADSDSVTNTEASGVYVAEKSTTETSKLEPITEELDKQIHEVEPTKGTEKPEQETTQITDKSTNLPIIKIEEPSTETTLLTKDIGQPVTESDYHNEVEHHTEIENAGDNDISKTTSQPEQATMKEFEEPVTKYYETPKQTSESNEIKSQTSTDKYEIHTTESPTVYEIDVKETTANNDYNVGITEKVIPSQENDKKEMGTTENAINELATNQEDIATTNVINSEAIATKKPLETTTDNISLKEHQITTESQSILDKNYPQPEIVTKDLTTETETESYSKGDSSYTTDVIKSEPEKYKPFTESSITTHAVDSIPEIKTEIPMTEPSKLTELIEQTTEKIVTSAGEHPQTENVIKDVVEGNTNAQEENISQTTETAFTNKIPDEHETTKLEQTEEEISTSVSPISPLEESRDKFSPEIITTEKAIIRDEQPPERIQHVSTDLPLIDSPISNEPTVEDDNKDKEPEHVTKISDKNIELTTELKKETSTESNLISKVEVDSTSTLVEDISTVSYPSLKETSPAVIENVHADTSEKNTEVTKEISTEKSYDDVPYEHTTEINIEYPKPTPVSVSPSDLSTISTSDNQPSGTPLLTPDSSKEPDVEVKPPAPDESTVTDKFASDKDYATTEVMPNRREQDDAPKDISIPSRDYLPPETEITTNSPIQIETHPIEPHITTVSDNNIEAYPTEQTDKLEAVTIKTIKDSDKLDTTTKFDDIEVSTKAQSYNVEITTDNTELSSKPETFTKQEITTEQVNLDITNVQEKVTEVPLVPGLDNESNTNKISELSTSNPKEIDITLQGSQSPKLDSTSIAPEITVTTEVVKDLPYTPTIVEEEKLDADRAVPTAEIANPTTEESTFKDEMANVEKVEQQPIATDLSNLTPTLSPDINIQTTQYLDVPAAEISSHVTEIQEVTPSDRLAEDDRIGMMTKATLDITTQKTSDISHDISMIPEEELLIPVHPEKQTESPTLERDETTLQTDISGQQLNTDADLQQSVTNVPEVSKDKTEDHKEIPVELPYSSTTEQEAAFTSVSDENPKTSEDSMSIVTLKVETQTEQLNAEVTTTPNTHKPDEEAPTKTTEPFNFATSEPNTSDKPTIKETIATSEIPNKTDDENILYAADHKTTLADAKLYTTESLVTDKDTQYITETPEQDTTFIASTVGVAIEDNETLRPTVTEKQNLPSPTLASSTLIVQTVTTESPIHKVTFEATTSVILENELEKESESQPEIDPTSTILDKETENEDKPIVTTESTATNKIFEVTTSIPLDKETEIPPITNKPVPSPNVVPYTTEQALIEKETQKDIQSVTEETLPIKDMYEVTTLASVETETDKRLDSVTQSVPDKSVVPDATIAVSSIDTTTLTYKLPEIIDKSSESTESTLKYSETTPYYIELQEHTHQSTDELSSKTPIEEQSTTEHYISEQPERGDQSSDKPDKYEDENLPPSSHTEDIGLTSPKDVTTQPSMSANTESDYEVTTENKQVTQQSSEKPKEEVNYTETPSKYEETSAPIPVSEVYTEKAPKPETEAPLEEFMKTTLTPLITKPAEELTTHLEDKYSKPEEKPIETVPSTEESKPELNEPVLDDDLPSPDFGTSGAGGYGQEPDYGDSEDQAFGPGTCRYGGKVYVSAQQIPRDDPCDFCFCFRSDIICLQQSCPPPIHGCHEEPIQGFCCPRYECPVSMATSLNVTTTTTTTTTTLPPHFLPHAYKGAAQRKGCQIKGHTYRVGEVVRASSGPCLHCTCGGDGQMKCDPKACTPEPMLRQMIAAAVSSKRRR